jgi:hypothetical protein
MTLTGLNAAKHHNRMHRFAYKTTLYGDAQIRLEPPSARRVAEGALTVLGYFVIVKIGLFCTASQKAGANHART